MQKPSWVFDTRSLLKDDDLIETELNFWKIEKDLCLKINFPSR